MSRSRPFLDARLAGRPTALLPVTPVVVVASMLLLSLPKVAVATTEVTATSEATTPAEGGRAPAKPREEKTPVPTPADPAAALLEANGAFQAGDYAQAARWYQAVLDSGIVNEDLLFNLGTAELRAGKRGRAILAFERALRLAPGDPDVRFNLTEARRGNIDKIVGERVEVSLLERLGARLPLEPIGHAFVVSWLFAFGLFALVRRQSGARVSLALAAGASAALAVILGALLAIGAWSHTRGVEAIVVAPSAPVREGPSDGFKVAFELHEGSKVRIVGEDGGFVRIRLPNGLEGWADAQQVPSI